MANEWWDDFFNNLATDLAPFISLFGESPTKQFLSESVSAIDIFIFALAPLGIITTVVSAIRVGGSPSLRAFIGRAQEGGGNIEAELCSSTSRDVCEMYNNGGIARVFGRPKILEVVHDPHADERDYYGMQGEEATAGIYSYREYISGVNGRKEWMECCSRSVPRPWKKAVTDFESINSPVDTTNVDFAPHPNLSLNVGIKKLSPVWFLLAALSGIVLQSGVLIFAGLSAFAFTTTFEKDEKPIEAYAFPFTLTGTVLLCVGIGMCGFVVERSTTERIFERKASKTNNPAHSRLFWIQPGNQVIGDQLFDPFAYNETSESAVSEYTTSWRDLQNTHLQKTNRLLVWVFAPLTIFGFVLQFIDLRALHSTVSIAQLGATLLMSVIRSMLRTERLQKHENRLADDPDYFQGHELDWLALEFSRDDLKRESRANSLLQSSDSTATFIWQVSTWPSCQDSARNSQRVHSRYFAQTSSNPGDGMRLEKSSQDADESPESDSQSTPNTNATHSPERHTHPCTWLADTQRENGASIPRLAPRIFLSRARIARMTGVMPIAASSRSDSSKWEDDLIPARKLAKDLCNAIRRTVDSLFSSSSAPAVFEDGWKMASTISLGLDCAIARLGPPDEARNCCKNLLQDIVYISLTRSSTDLGVIHGQ